MDQRLLIDRWRDGFPSPLDIYDEASVSLARQKVRELGSRLELPVEAVETVTLIASELTTNHLRHARGGIFSIRECARGGVRGLEVVAMDCGPGLMRPERAIHETVSTAGGLGAGLAAVRRLADEVDFDIRLGEGTCVTARKFGAPVPAATEVAILGRPYPGERISGDDAVFLRKEGGLLAAVSDGLGHGYLAREASHRAVSALKKAGDGDPASLIASINEKLVGTRGAAMALADYDAPLARVRGACVGDVTTQLYYLKDTYDFPCTPHTLGDNSRPSKRISIGEKTAPPGAVLVLFTDGLRTQASLRNELDVLRQPAVVIASYLLEKFGRNNDDALVLVARLAGS